MVKFLTDVLGYSQIEINRKKGKEAERQRRSHHELLGEDVRRIPDHIGGRDFEIRRRKFYE